MSRFFTSGTRLRNLLSMAISTAPSHHPFPVRLVEVVMLTGADQYAMFPPAELTYVTSLHMPYVLRTHPSSLSGRMTCAASDDGRQYKSKNGRTTEY